MKPMSPLVPIESAPDAPVATAGALERLIDEGTLQRFERAMARPRMPNGAASPALPLGLPSPSMAVPPQALNVAPQPSALLRRTIPVPDSRRTSVEIDVAVVLPAFADAPRSPRDASRATPPPTRHSEEEDVPPASCAALSADRRKGSLRRVATNFEAAQPPQRAKGANAPVVETEVVLETPSVPLPVQWVSPPAIVKAPADQPALPVPVRRHPREVHAAVHTQWQHPVTPPHVGTTQVALPNSVPQPPLAPVATPAIHTWRAAIDVAAPLRTDTDMLPAPAPVRPSANAVRTEAPVVSPLVVSASAPRAGVVKAVPQEKAVSRDVAPPAAPPRPASVIAPAPAVHAAPVKPEAPAEAAPVVQASFERQRTHGPQHEAHSPLQLVASASPAPEAPVRVTAQGEPADSIVESPDSEEAAPAANHREPEAPRARDEADPPTVNPSAIAPVATATAVQSPQQPPESSLRRDLAAVDRVLVDWTPGMESVTLTSQLPDTTITVRQEKASQQVVVTFICAAEGSRVQVEIAARGLATQLSRELSTSSKERRRVVVRVQSATGAASSVLEAVADAGEALE